tara:strand:- start:43 stop:1980 length:1938 start_codon:yes stop_codon:yes gene_type:complete
MPFEKSGRYGAPEVATAPVALSIDDKISVMAGSLVSIQSKISEMVGIMKDAFNLEKLAEQREELARRDAKLKAGETQKAPADTGTTAATDLSGMFSGLGKVASGPWGKIALLVGSLSALFLLSDKIIPKIAAVAEFIKTKFIPGIQDLHETIMSTDTGYLGITGAAGLTGVTFTALKTFFTTTGTKLTKAVSDIWGKAGTGKFLKGDTLKITGKASDTISDFMAGVKNIMTSVKNAFPSTLKVGFKNVGKWLGSIGRFVKNLFSSMVGIANTTLKLLPGAKSIIRFGAQFAKFFGPLGLILQAVIGVFSAVKGAVEGYKEGGVMGAITGAMTGLWDGLVGSVLNMITSVLSWILDKLGLDKAAAWLKKLDFSADSIINFFTVTIPGYIGDLAKWFTDLFPDWEGLKAVFVSALNFTGAIGWLWSKIKTPLTGLISWFGDLLPSWDTIKASLLTVLGFHPAVWLWNKIKEPLSGLVAWFGTLLPSWDDVKAKLGDWTSFDFGDWLGSKLSNLMSRITGVFTRMINGLKSGVNALIDKANFLIPAKWEIPKFEMDSAADFSADDTPTLPEFTTTGGSVTAEDLAVEAERKAAVEAAFDAQGNTVIQNNASTGDQIIKTDIASADLSSEHSDSTAHAMVFKMRGMGGR